MTSVLRLAAATAATLLASHAHATTQLHTDFLSFLSSLQGGAYIESFNGLDSNVEPSSFSGLGYSYTLSAPGGLYATGTAVGTNFAEEVLTIDLTGGAPVTAVGGNFYGTDFDGDFVADETITLTLGDGSYVSYTPTAATNFIGFVSSAPIASVSIEFTYFWVGRYATVDNLTVGASAVPEPGQWALMAAGLAALGMLKRRRSA